ncbi:uncharacterized protein N7496_002572 [Penicillium cataractarum]|uniref:Thioesterase domain-containing protein n=1 Tax=Penicillium cataractarum TaxID=2100454 RepID=A0A9W9SM14_9EURO|nr:uncharacterized protein N7496_002572 [Penicillium cataractarum]KAJ5380144.1 hypothetical protein N7496_002572 [Penicillium cataractarum]
MIPRSAVLRRPLASSISYIHTLRPLSTTAPILNARASAPENPPTRPHGIDPRWLTMMKRRIGRCMMFGLKPAQIDDAGKILQQLARDWRELIAGSEGFLTDEKRRSLYRHNVVWGEMDIMGHVNNVTYVRYAESARVNWTRNIGLHIDPANKDKWTNLLNSTGIGLILRSIKVDYKFVSDLATKPIKTLPVLTSPQPMTWPDKITIYQKLVHDPSSSLSSQSAFQLQVMILSEARQRPAARCHEDIVTYDYKKNRKTPELPPFLFEQFKVIWELQEKAKKDWQERILEIENRVRTLEVESWDRADAVEDTGSA